MPSPPGRFISLCVRLGRHAPWVGLVLCLAVLTAGFELDDLYLVTADRGPLEFLSTAFSVIGGADRPSHFVAADRPWWTASGLQLDFFRPVAALTHLVDRALWPEHPALHHLHSLGWYVALIAAVRGAYRKLDDDPMRVGLASFIFAVCQAHAMNAGWIAGRNALVGAVLVVVALRLHHRGRGSGSLATVGGGAAVFGLALLANEGAVAGLGFVAAYAWVLDRRPRRWVALLPHVAVVVAWRLAYQALGYGAAHSGMYFDPGAAPGAYVVRTLAQAIPMLAGSLGLGILDPWGSMSGGVETLVVLSLPFVVAIGWLARERVRADPVVRMWTVGVVLALITAGTTVPTDRGLLLLTVGTSVLVADLLLVFRRPDAGWMRRAMGGLLIACHLVLSPLLLPVRVRSTGWIQGFVDVIYERLPRGPRATQHVVLVNSPSDLSMLYSRTIAQHRGEPFFASFQWLYAGMAPLTLERVADHAFVVSSTRPWLAAPLDRGFRAELDFAVGQRFEGTCLDAVIETVDDASRPTAVRFEYDPDCELVWLVWNDGGPAPLSVPPVGGRVELPAAVLE